MLIAALCACICTCTGTHAARHLSITSVRVALVTSTNGIEGSMPSSIALQRGMRCEYIEGSEPVPRTFRHRPRAGGEVRTSWARVILARCAQCAHRTWHALTGRARHSGRTLSTAPARTQLRVTAEAPTGGHVICDLSTYVHVRPRMSTCVHACPRGSTCLERRGSDSSWYARA